MTSSQCNFYWQEQNRRWRRRFLLIFFCVILRGPSSANAFVVGSYRYPKTIRRRLSSSTTSTGSFLEPSNTLTQRRVTFRMGASNDNTRYLNNTDTSACDSHVSRQQRPRHEGGTTVDKDLGQLQSRIDAMMAEIIWATHTRGPPNSDLGPIEFVEAVLNALDHPDDPLPDSGFRTLIRSSSKKWREQTRKSVGAPSEASEDSIARALGQAMSRPGSPFALMVDSAGDRDCTSSVTSLDVLDFEDGTAWLSCVFHRCEGMNKTPILATKWSLVRRESDGAWLIDDILFNDDLSEE